MMRRWEGQVAVLRDERAAVAPAAPAPPGSRAGA